MRARRLLPLVLVALLAGCVDGQRSIHASFGPATRDDELPEVSCGRTIAADRERLAPGHVVFVRVAHSNCDWLPAGHEEDACGATFEHAGERWSVGAGAAMPLAGCDARVEDGWLRPGGERSSLGHWNGTVRNGEGVRPVPPGVYVLRARGVPDEVAIEVLAAAVPTPQTDK